MIKRLFISFLFICLMVSSVSAIYVEVSVNFTSVTAPDYTRSMLANSYGYEFVDNIGYCQGLPGRSKYCIHGFNQSAAS